MSYKLNPSIAALNGKRLQENASHKAVHKHWHSFRRRALRAMSKTYGDAVTSGRKTLKLTKGELQTDADLVVTLSFKEGIALYLPDERRWVVSFPQQHHARGLKKERAANNRFKRTIRMFKAARNRLVEKKMLTKDDAPSYFIECLLYNIPNELFTPKLAPTYTGILDWLNKTNIQGFKCQNERVDLFGLGREQWTEKKARTFTRALQEMWDTWD